MVPEGWKQESLGSLFELKNGLNTEKDQYGSGYKFVNVMDVFKNDILTESKIIGRVQVTDSQLEGYQIKYGDVLFNRTSETFDEIAMAAVYLDDAIATFGGFVIRGRPTGDDILSDYSPFLFQSKNYRSQAIKLGQGAVRANIGQKDLSKVLVLLPPLPEQKKIAQILSTWDKAITTTEQLLANSQQQKKALMQQLLTGKKRLLDQNGERFQGEWLRNSLKDLVEIIYGKSPKEVVSPTGSFPIYGTGGIGGFASEALCEETAVLIGRKGTIDKPLYISEPFWAIDTTFYCLPKTDTDLKWFYYLVGSLKLRSFSEASGVPSLSRETLNAIKVSVPSTIEEQQKIAAVLSAADQEITTLQQKLNHLKQEKKALMQQLLTGKRRVRLNDQNTKATTDGN
ncbi:type I restriction enzyme, S subunit [Allopseudospirillum japonicum]|uniref:Type I restriction enzyme, S subunit n=1 Tax=Allopseudospirillum japonicum TaxID=64971 RepID=A0A1H6SWP0_9GAMM|nr:restriction endonuclease subunit S [Allopseudospirillum japonicum]SEI71306.1 type I restriction enzyme, S subunit [Allopseudospirillum japonicum]